MLRREVARSLSGRKRERQRLRLSWRMRAAVCVECPLNGKGGWESYFTVPVSNAIRRELERKRTMKLETQFDDRVGVCEACSCPLQLKIWLPIENILSKVQPAQFDALAPGCWIRSERAQLEPLQPI